MAAAALAAAMRLESFIVKSETDLQGDLILLDVSVLEHSSYLGELEPIEVAQCSGGAFNTVLDRRVEILGGRADDVVHDVRVVFHV
jgi:hypothetical protein